MSAKQDEHFEFCQLTSPIAPEKLQEFGEFLSANIFESFNLLDFMSKCLSVRKLSIHWAEAGSKIVALKIGYEKDTGHFYSWLGGVAPDYRSKGLGRKLMHKQHEWCLEHGYKLISTKTMNRWKTMLLMNIQEGFEIQGTQLDRKGQLKILMIKKLKNEIKSDT